MGNGVYTGDIILPDGRVVHGRVATSYESDTNAVNVHRCDLSWPDGDDLTADEYNEDLGGVYLHEFAVDALLLKTPEGDDEP